MRRMLMVLSLVAFVGCSLFGGSGKPDPTKGWSGVWTGRYSSSYGGSGSLELELSTDTLGTVVGVARFEAGYGLQRSRLDSLVLTVDSLRTAMRFDGLRAAIVGKRLGDAADGAYTVRPGGGGEIVDAGSWTLARRPVER